MRFVLFGCIRDVWLPYETRCKMGRTSAKVRSMKSRQTFRNEHTQSTPLDRKLTFLCIWYYLGAFGTVWLPYETRCETVVQKFVPRSRVEIFQYERIRSTPLHRKQTFWCVSYYLVAFVTVWLPCETRCKTGRTSAIVRATKSRRMFLQRTHAIHPVGP